MLHFPLCLFVIVGGVQRLYLPMTPLHNACLATEPKKLILIDQNLGMKDLVLPLDYFSNKFISADQSIR